MPSEPVFVPRPNGESEDDGENTVWFACTMYDMYIQYVVCECYCMSSKVQMDRNISLKKIRSLMDSVCIDETVC